MPAQRFQDFHPTPAQTVLTFKGSTLEVVEQAINHHLSRMIVEIKAISMTHIRDADVRDSDRIVAVGEERYSAIVVFGEASE